MAPKGEMELTLPNLRQRVRVTELMVSEALAVLRTKEREMRLATEVAREAKARHEEAKEALAMAEATRAAFIPLVASLKGSTATRISSSASPQVSAISVPGVLARLMRRDSATRDKMPICGCEGCCQLMATIIVEAMG